MNDLKLCEELLVPFLKPSAVKIGASLGSILGWILDPIILAGNKREISNEHNLRLYAEEISRAVNNIQDENIVAPEMHKLSHIVDQSKYLISEESFRLRFAELIAATCDKTKTDSIKPIHSQILLNMSNVDAHIFNFICLNFPNSGFVAIKPTLLTKNPGSFGERKPFPEVYLIDPVSVLDEEIKNENGIVDLNIYSDIIISESIDTLISLGLITPQIMVNLQLTDPQTCTERITSSYPFFLASDTYSDYILAAKKLNQVVSAVPHILLMTTLGESFAKLTLGIEFTNPKSLFR